MMHGPINIRYIYIYIYIYMPCSFSASVLQQNILRDQKKLIIYEARNIKYCEGISVFLPSLSGIQITPLQGRIISSSVACLTVPYFSTLSHKRLDFRRKLLCIKCVCLFSLQISSPTYLTLRRYEWDIAINVHRSSCKIPVIRLINLEFPQQIF